MDADPSLRELAALVSRPDGRLDLARAALTIAQWEYPALEVDAYLERLDGLARGDTPNLAPRKAAPGHSIPRTPRRRPDSAPRTVPVEILRGRLAPEQG